MVLSTTIWNLGHVKNDKVFPSIDVTERLPCLYSNLNDVSYVRSTRVINDMIYDYDESSIRSYTFA